MEYDFEVYGNTAPTTLEPDNGDPLARIGNIARLADRHGFEGLLVYYQHGTLDPWVTASAIMQQTDKLTPLIALQPNSLPPFTAAKIVHTLVALYGRRVDLNLITGGNEGELRQVGDQVEHDGRFERALEYMSVLRALLTTNERLDHEGQHYTFRGLRTFTSLPPDQQPRIFVPGSSEAGRRVARAIGDVALTHPEPVDRFADNFAKPRSGENRLGVRFGIIARESDDKAWEAAQARSTESRSGRLQVRMRKHSDSDHIRRMAYVAEEGELHDNVYWTGPYRNGRGYMPYLVGSYDRVAAYARRYLDCGVRTILLGSMANEEEFEHAGVVLSRLRGADSANAHAAERLIS
ncbi:LLM class flavin-dependent oxidoreductase [Streptomyces hokutonensis]|uniref:LLM class flavin-dependent oxidoreductase n=1 Tax=Streptomyces hokutonensis TaxID=1306990 RepID=UPI0003632CD1|nr:LLM class flavin-dependent oxidoreductase [Streptomyces hokutonensis]